MSTVGFAEFQERLRSALVSRLRPRRGTRFDMVVWELTLRCDQACRHCGSRAGRARVHELDTEEALRVVRQLADVGVREVALIGGEAYLRSDWALIARAITDHGMECSMVTGGRGVDATVAARAKAAGVVNVSVSIDGLEATHDLQRGGRGSHRSALAALGHLRKAGVPTSVNTQVNGGSSTELESLFAVLRGRRIWAWRVQLTVPMGRAADQPDWLLQPYELLGLFPRLAALAEACSESGIVFSPGDNIGYFGPFEALLRNPGGGRCHWSGCHAGKRTLGIQADGTVKGCLSLPTNGYAGFDLRELPLREGIERSPSLGAAIQSADRLWGFCGTCYYAEACRGGCTWTSYTLFGRPGNNPYCHHRALDLEKRGLRERLVSIKSAPGVPFDTGRFVLVLEANRGKEGSDADPM